MVFNLHFRSKMVAGFHQNCCDDSNSDSDFESEFDSYQKLVEFNRNWSKRNRFGHFQRRFWYKSTLNRLLQSFNRLFWSFIQTFQSFYRSFNQIRLNLDRKRSILYKNPDCWFGIIVGFQIGPKSTIKFGHGFLFDDNNSICYP